jgi:hypothetical protein
LTRFVFFTSTSKASLPSLDEFCEDDEEDDDSEDDDSESEDESLLSLELLLSLSLELEGVLRFLGRALEL